MSGACYDDKHGSAGGPVVGVVLDRRIRHPFVPKDLGGVDVRTHCVAAHQRIENLLVIGIVQ